MDATISLVRRLPSTVECIWRRAAISRRSRSSAMPTGSASVPKSEPPTKRTRRSAPCDGRDSPSPGQEQQYGLFRALVAHRAHVVATRHDDRGGVIEGRGERPGRTADRVLPAAHNEHGSRRARKLGRRIGLAITTGASCEGLAIFSRLLRKDSKTHYHRIGDLGFVGFEQRVGDRKAPAKRRLEVCF